MYKQVAMTNHGYKRIKERMGLSKSAAKRLSQKVWDSVGEETTYKGALLEYALAKGELKGAIVKLYGENVFLYQLDDDTPLLVTAFPVPKELRNQALAYNKKRSAG